MPKINTLPGKKLNFWPWIIAGIFMVVVTAIILTLYLTLQKPLEYDPYFGGNVDYVKSNIIKIEKDDAEFNRKYNLEVLSKLANGSNRLELLLTKKDGTPAKNATINAHFTRPATNLQDITVGQPVFDDGRYISPPFTLLTEGIWKLEMSIRIDELEIHRTVPYRFTE